jgi:hypothetical protein
MHTGAIEERGVLIGGVAKTERHTGTGLGLEGDEKSKVEAPDLAPTITCDLHARCRLRKSYVGMVPRAGIEPATRGFSVRCSTN